jgi:hypothetical protein
MPTLRQKVNAFCKGTESKVSKSDKLLVQVLDLKIELKKLKETHKNALKAEKTKAKTMKAPKAAKAPAAPKMTSEEKGQAKREKAVAKELAKEAKRKEKASAKALSDEMKNEKAVAKELAKAAKPKQEVVMNPLPASPMVASAGRRTRRRRL